MKQIKNNDFDFLTGSERFFDDFDKMIFLHFFVFFFRKCPKIIKKTTTSHVFGTNARRERDFHGENSQNGTGIINFRSTGTHFMTFFMFFFFRKFFLVLGKKRKLMSRGHFPERS